MTDIDSIHIHFNSDNLWVVNLTLSLVMFGVALDIKVSDFTNLLKSPRPVIVGIVSQFILIPLVTFLMIIMINPYPSVALGMIMVAACPGGNISNFMTKLAGGNTALSVSLTAFASLAALVMTPLNFAIWGSFYTPTKEILKSVQVSPTEVARFVLLILGIPLILGMVIKNYHPNFATKASRFLKPISILIFLSFIVVAFYNNLDIFMDHIHYVFFLVIAHNTLLLLTGFYFARMNKLSYLDQKTLSIETGIQNSGLGLLLVFSFFDGLGGMALLVAFWAIWDIASGLLIAYFWSEKTVKENK
ncbi:bile acid:sodium symporter family protein [Lutimonas zeaxanthinifaciens]|uniref:bile acid:sodium symporter family protein n=1 Tax=Lutimonas zeaxanthinifaciens TaxID=3060215 RepID=UPI00265CA3AA|nr:bile acid:sodium symporter family protein [Lutimonas sp. YSD2104]WKK65208.1 bile acid:sodium symporter family protein [Lutimonas sp. YSD2104]